MSTVVEKSAVEPDDLALLARFETAKNEALDSVPLPAKIKKIPLFPWDYLKYAADDDPPWFMEVRAAYVAWRRDQRTALDEALLTQFSRAELERLDTAWKTQTASTDQWFGAHCDVARAVQIARMRARHALLVRMKAEGTLPSRVCPVCTMPLSEAMWDAGFNDTLGLFEVEHPATCALEACRAAYRRDADGHRVLDFAWGHCCVWCQRFFETEAVAPGDRPPEAGEPGHDPETTAAWQCAASEYNTFQTFCSAWCFAIGVGPNLFDEWAVWDTTDVPRTWSGSPWPRTTYLSRPPATLAERKRLADGKSPGSVVVAWEGLEPRIEGGVPHPWMFQQPLWERALREYAERCGARSLPPHHGSVAMLGGRKALLALPPATPTRLVPTEPVEILSMTPEAKRVLRVLRRARGWTAQQRVIARVGRRKAITLAVLDELVASGLVARRGSGTRNHAVEYTVEATAVNMDGCDTSMDGLKPQTANKFGVIERGR